MNNFSKDLNLAQDSCNDRHYMTMNVSSKDTPKYTCFPFSAVQIDIKMKKREESINSEQANIPLDYLNSEFLKNAVDSLNQNSKKSKSLIKHSFKRLKTKKFTPISEAIFNSRTKGVLSKDNKFCNSKPKELMIINSISHNQSNNLRPNSKSFNTQGEGFYPRTSKYKLGRGINYYPMPKDANFKINKSHNSHSLESQTCKANQQINEAERTTFREENQMTQKYSESSKSNLLV